MGAEVTMVWDVADDPGSVGDRPFLSAVMPLNEQRRNDALYLLAREYRRTLTQFDICKTHIVADAFQVIQTGKAIFGGPLYAMKHGPVPTQTLDHCRVWARNALVAGVALAALAPLQLVSESGKFNHIKSFGPSPIYARANEASWDWFSDQEQRNIHDAYALVMRMSWSEADHYFHNPTASAIGYAYDVATRHYPKPLTTIVEMNWFDVLDGAEKVEHKDVSYARAMLGLWA